MDNINWKCFSLILQNRLLHGYERTSPQLTSTLEEWFLSGRRAAVRSALNFSAQVAASRVPARTTFKVLFVPPPVRWLYCAAPEVHHAQCLRSSWVGTWREAQRSRSEPDGEMVIVCTHLAHAEQQPCLCARKHERSGRRRNERGGVAYI